jgi:Icc-related predicted phosphoesterase
MKPILVIGDIHGEFDTLFRVLDASGVENCTLICVGDLGIGFINSKKQLKQIEILQNSFKKRGIEFFSIRGNHDDPSYFDGSVNFSHFKLISDYSFFEINEIKFGFIGGAVSVDRKLRKEGVNWWKEEGVVFDPSRVQECDVLITHAGSTWNPTFFKRDAVAEYGIKDLHLKDDCGKEKRQVSELISLCKPKKHFCGHFHFYSLAENNGCVSRVLDIMEIVELRV